MKAASTEKTLISFRSTGICLLNSGTVAHKDFLLSVLEVLNAMTLCQKID
jgi:hypothetical protein